MNARLATIVAALAVAAASANASPAVIDRSVHRALASADRVDIVVEMKDTANVIESFQEAAYPSRSDRINALKTKLEKASALALQPLANLFVQESATVGLDIKTFWIAPKAVIKGATFELVEKIASLPNVAAVREQRVIKVAKPIIESSNSINAAVEAVQGTEWGVAKISAPQVWADGNIGQGVLVGSIDTGVRASHEALVKNFAGKYGWFDPELKTAVPHDDNGHGTHTMGTIAGAKGVGVAPGAKWMSCRGCRTEDCPESDLLDCAQFILCPTDTDGNNADCSKAPRLVSNSWGGGQAETWYKPAVDAWRKAGIIPVFAMGNEGPACATASSPGDYPNVIGVGSTTKLDALSGFSSKGPTIGSAELRSLIKPDISAPGSQVRSAWNETDNGYLTISGTSMATPHVSGAIALLLSQEPELTYEQVLVRLVTTTDQNGLRPSGYSCNTSDAVWPNNQFGHGRLNIFSAYQGYRSAPVTSAPTPVPTTIAPVTPAPTTPAPTTPAPTTPAPTTPAPTTPKPTTVAPTPAPTPAPTSRYEADCNRIWQLFCSWNMNCKWDSERKICAAKK